MEKTTRNIWIVAIALIVIFIVVFAVVSTNNQNKDNEWSERCKNELAKMGYDNITDFSCDSTEFGDSAYCNGSFRHDGKAYTYHLGFKKVGSDWLKDSGWVDPIVSQSGLFYSFTELPNSESQLGIVIPEYVFAR